MEIDDVLIVTAGVVVSVLDESSSVTHRSYHTLHVLYVATGVLDLTCDCYPMYTSFEFQSSGRYQDGGFRVVFPLSPSVNTLN